MSDKQRILQLLDSDQGLTCLPHYWKNAVRDYGRTSSSATQLRQLRVRLEQLAEHVEPLAIGSSQENPFSKLIAEVARVDDADAVASHLGLRTVDPNQPGTWLNQLVPGQMSLTAEQQLCGVVICWIVVPLQHPDPTSDVAEFLNFKLPLLLLTALHLLNAHASIAGLAEQMVEMTAADYSDRESLAKALSDSPLSRFNDRWSVAQFVYLLATSLQWVPNRSRRHSVLLLETWLGIELDHYAERERLKAALAQGPLGSIVCAVTQANLVSALANSLAALPDDGSPTRAVTLLEAWLGLDYSDYTSRQQLATALAHSALAKVRHQPIWASVLATLARSLAIVRTRGKRQALMLLGTWLDKWIGVPQARFDSEEQLAEAMLGCLHEHLGDSDIIAYMVEVLTACWIDVAGNDPKIARQTVALIEASLGIAVDDYDDHGRLNAKLDDARLRRFDQPEMLVLNLAAALSKVDGRISHAPQLIETWLDIPVADFARSPRLQQVPTTTMLRFPQAWLRAVGAQHAQVPDVCDAVAEFVKNVQMGLRTSPHARDDFLHEMVALGREIVGLGLERARQARLLGQRREADALELRALMWAEQFENRTLAERAAAEHRYPVSPQCNLKLANNHWPFQFVNQPADEDFHNGYLPKTDAGDQPLQWRDDAEQLPSLAKACDAHQGQPDNDAWGAVRRAVANDCGDFHSMLPPNVVLLRTLFDRVGALHWWALRRDSDRVEILAREQSEPLADARLKIASFAFDLAVESIWAKHLTPFQREVLSAQQQDDLLYIAELTADAAFAHRELASTEKCKRLFDSVDHALNAVRRTHPVFAKLGDNFLAHLFWQPDGHRVEAPGELLALWRDTTKSLRIPWPEQWGSSARDDRRRRELDAVTEQFRLAVEKEMSLSTLWTRTNGKVDWQSTDVVFQLQWALWAAPMAWLDFGGRPLFERVASTSSAISLTWRRDAERRAAQESSPRRLISANWLDERDWKRPMRGLGMLHGALQRLATRYAWDVYGLADEPIASDENLRSLLSQPTEASSDVVVIGGHGHCAEAGIQLAEGVWTGHGADLRNVNLLFLVACAVGRLEQSGFRDVEGMYANLAAQGCPSVVAARWPIADTEAAVFAAEFFKQYMEANQHFDHEPTFARARALNQARRNLFKRHAESLITPHLAAAFELYGLG